MSDQVPEFILEFWEEICRILQIKMKLSTSQQPQADSETDIANQYMEQQLRPYVKYDQDEWSEHLWLVDFAVACLPSTSTSKSPFITERGYEPRTSFEKDDHASAEARNAQTFMEHLHETWQQDSGQIQHA